MPVIRGDRIGESSKLSAVSQEAQWFYAAFIASVPDDFGRFRFSAAHVAIRMSPRKEPTVGSLRRVSGHLRALAAAGLWSTWEVDGVTFGEVTGWKPTGNLYHRTPEPPGSTHGHSRRCATTAMCRAAEWGQAEEAERLRLWLKGMGGTDVEQDPSRTRAEVEHPSPPSPPSLYVVPTAAEVERAAVVPTTGPARPDSCGPDHGPETALAGPEWFPPGHPRREQPPEPVAFADVVPDLQWIDHDPEDPDQAALASRCVALEVADAARDGRPPSREGAAEILLALSTTRTGVSLDGGSIRGKSVPWLVATLSLCDRFAEETGLAEPP